MTSECQNHSLNRAYSRPSCSTQPKSRLARHHTCIEFRSDHKSLWAERERSGAEREREVVRTWSEQWAGYVCRSKAAPP